MKSKSIPSAAPKSAGTVGGDMQGAASMGDRLRYLTDEQLRQGIELMFFAYRAFTLDPDDILFEHGYGRAHHRALHFIGAGQARTVTELIDILGVTKQSLNRVLRELLANGLVERRVGATDRRQRPLALTEEGAALERRLAEAQQARMRRAYREAGPDAVAGFRKVLERMLDEDARESQLAFVGRRERAGEG